MIAEGLVGPATYTDGNLKPPRIGHGGEVITGSANGDLYEQTRAGNAFIYTAETAAALLLSATTGNVPTIFNPLGSGVNVSIQKLRITYVSGTLVVGGVVWAQTLNAGSSVATGAAILTGTHVAPRSAMIGGSGAASAVRFFPAISTFTAAPTVIAATGLQYNTTALIANPWQEEVNGALVIAPGAALSVCYTVTTSTALFFVTIEAIEVPV